MLAFACPSCGTQLQMPEELAGKKVRCASCKSVVTAPAQAAGSDAVTAEPAAPAAPAVSFAAEPAEPKRARRHADDDVEDADDEKRGRGPRRDASNAAAVGTGIGVGVIVAIVLGVGACLLIPCLIALLVPAVQKVREAAARTQTMNNMKQIALGCLSHHDTFRTFPTPKVLVPPQNVQAVDLSWRVSILPFVEQQNMFAQFDQTAAWNAPRNQGLLNGMPMIYTDVRRGPVPGGSTTEFQYFTGPKTLWPTNNKVGVADIPDGTSNTFLFAEAANPVPWTQPADMAIQPGQAPLPLAAPNFLVSMADGSVRLVDRARVPDATLRLYIDPRDGAVPPALD